MSAPLISFANLSFILIPVVIVLVILFVWSLNPRNAVYALARMLGQLLMIGYILTYIFTTHNYLLILLVLTLMITASSWIALGPIKQHRLTLLKPALLSTFIGSATTLAIVTQLVMELDPWYNPQFMIPMAGMLFANSMNAMSIAGERLYSEFGHGEHYQTARKTAYQAALIPNINSLFAVGLVSLPGMMTGQILSGVSPLIAVRYQILVMCMIFGSAGISVFCFLIFGRKVFQPHGSATE